MQHFLRMEPRLQVWLRLDPSVEDECCSSASRMRRIIKENQSLYN